MIGHVCSHGHVTGRSHLITCILTITCVLTITCTSDEQVCHIGSSSMRLCSWPTRIHRQQLQCICNWPTRRNRQLLLLPMQQACSNPSVVAAVYTQWASVKA